jgi:hypothetical protein
MVGFSETSYLFARECAVSAEMCGFQSGKLHCIVFSCRAAGAAVE